MTDTELYLAARTSLIQRTLVSSGVGLLLAAASRIPTWEVGSPVAWLVGTVSVAFLPIFGPIILLGAYCYTYSGILELLALRGALAKNAAGLTDGQRALLRIGTPARTGVERVVGAGLWLWTLAVPLVAYLILLGSFFDFVRPKAPESTELRFQSRTAQIADLLVGAGGWSGFKPLTPSIRDNLVLRLRQAKDDAEKARVQRLTETVPWVYPPIQTWLYLGGFGLLLWLAAKALPLLRGAPPDL